MIQVVKEMLIEKVRVELWERESKEYDFGRKKDIVLRVQKSLVYLFF